MITSHIYNLLLTREIGDARRYINLIESFSSDEIHLLKIFLLYLKGDYDTSLMKLSKLKIEERNHIEKFAQSVLEFMIYTKKTNWQKSKSIEDILHQAERFYQINEEETGFIWLSFLYDTLGDLYIKEDTSKAMKEYQTSLDLRKNIESRLFTAVSLSKIAKIYQLNGEYISANANFCTALEYAEPLAAEKFCFELQLNIGITNFFMGKIGESLNYISKSLSSVKVDKNPLHFAKAYFFSTLCLIEQQQHTQAQQFIGLLDELAMNHNQPVIIQYNKLAIALRDKVGTGFTQKANAMQLLNEICTEGFIDDINISRLAMINLADLLLEEYSIFRDEHSYTQLFEILNHLYDIAHTQKSNSMMIQVLIFQSQYALINGNLDMMNKFLDEAETLSQLHNINKHIIQIQNIRQKMETEIQKWDKIINIEKNAEEVQKKLLDYLSDIGHIVRNPKE